MKKVILGVVIVALIGGAWFAMSNKRATETTITPESTQTVDVALPTPPQPVEQMMGTGTTGDAAQSDAMKQEFILKATMENPEPAAYGAYSEMIAKSNLIAGKHVVLFFYAGRCPSCRSLDKELMAKLSTLPNNTVVLKVDYDNATDLKKQYGVTSQHTLVRVDKDMNLVAKQTGGDVDAVIKLLQ